MTHNQENNYCPNQQQLAEHRMREEIRNAKDEMRREMREEIRDATRNMQHTLSELRDTKKELEKTKENLEKTEQKQKLIFGISAGVLALVLILLIEDLSLNRFEGIKRLIAMTYPPEEIYDKVIENDNINLDKIQSIEEQAPKKVKEWMNKWDAEDVKDIKIFSTREFQELMGEVANGRYYEALGISSSSKQISADTVKDIGNAISFPVEIVPIGQIKGPTKVCGRVIKQDEKAAIFIYPKDSRRTEYRWLGCSEQFPKRTYLGIFKSGDGVEMFDDVLLKEVRRESSRDGKLPQLLVTNSVAEALGIYPQGTMRAYINVTNAEE